MLMHLTKYQNEISSARNTKKRMLQLSTVVVIVVVRRSRGNKKFATQLTRLRNISEAIRWRDYINCYQRFAKSIFHYLHSDEATDKLVLFSRSWLRIIAKVIEWKTFSRSTFIFTSNVNRSFARWNFEIPFALWPGPRWLRRKWVRPFFSTCRLFWNVVGVGISQIYVLGELANESVWKTSYETMRNLKTKNGTAAGARRMLIVNVFR